MTELTPQTWADLLELAAVAREVRHHRQRGECAADLTDFTARLARFDGADRGLMPVYARLIETMAAGPLTIAQLGQSLDGRIATASGHSRYINGEASLDHLHRLRALVDAVVVGASTVQLDDPQLTTRRVAGRNPMRIVLDPYRRLPTGVQVFDGSVPTLILVAGPEASHPAARPPAVSVAAVGAGERSFMPADILRCLWQRGLHAVLVEGGARTVSLFLHHRQVDRLHIAVAPILVGSGTSAVSLPPIERIDDAARLTTHVYPLGRDVLFDCQLT